MPKNTYDKELAFAKDLAARAGKIMNRYFRAADIGTHWKEDNTPLTIADTTINSLVIERVKQEFPEHGVIGEEESYKQDSSFVWVVDPIDGTMPFSLGMPISTFSLGLVDRKDGQAVVGVVYEPFLDHLYVGVRGHGATLNDVPIHTSKQTDTHNGYFSMIGGFKNKEYNAEHACTLLKEEGGKYFNLLSQVYAAVKVATGEFLGGVFGYGSPWDSAGSSVIIEEAGGIVTDMKGKIRRYDDWADGAIFAANKEVHKKLVEIVKRSMTKEKS